MKPPTDLCSGTCGGKRENCPVPMACGWPEEDALGAKSLNLLGTALVVIGLLVFCGGVFVWL